MKSKNFDKQFDEGVGLTASLDLAKAKRVLQEPERAKEFIYESEISHVLRPREGVELTEARRTLAIAQLGGLIASRIGFAAILGAVILGNLGISRAWPIYWPVAAMIFIGVTAIVIRIRYLVKDSHAERLVKKLESIPPPVVARSVD
ncbi:hypothetical protein [Polaromonas eurypsychrophila]|uniref:Uncharacterized protein n=1 Tax=Polaromonas eurypsychrophila TaxID=1614635 RepID=A0A916WMB1_9BURK|nr:hypothetical protein [Polaromonas eurypsychrophila]GGB11786.1 hypothetical protein GCM10011496_35830 [Polaromonas eurypsychrophila]